MKKLLSVLFLMVCLCYHLSAQWAIEMMSEQKDKLQTAVLGDYVYIIGGSYYQYISDKVEVFNTVSQTWMPTMNMSVQRAVATAVASNSALYIAGGVIQSTTSYVLTNTVDIYKDGVWRTDTLPGGNYMFGAKGVFVGDKVMIAGGYISKIPAGTMSRSDLVFIYDESTGIWSIDTLSEKRVELAVASDGMIAVFAGGGGGGGFFSNTVDIYNSNSNTWHTDTLSEPRRALCGIYAAGKFYFAGGYNSQTTSSDVVDIYDGTQWTTANLWLPRGDLEAAVAGDKVVFTGGGDLDLITFHYYCTYNVVDVYDIHSDTWSTTTMNYDKALHASVGVNNKIYVAGGTQRLGSSYNILSTLEIWDITSGIESHHTTHYNLQVFPNPATNQIEINGLEDLSGVRSTAIYSIDGALVVMPDNQSGAIDISNLRPGIYFLRIVHDNGTTNLRFVKG
jgi:hypothetical protein